MNTDEALAIFNIKYLDINKEDEVKKTYKRLMIKYHPDNYGSNDIAIRISEAYSIIKSLYAEFKRYEILNHKSALLNIIISIKDLIELYNGKSITIAGKEENSSITLYRNTIKRHSLALMCKVTLTYKGIKINYTSIQPWNIKDEYNIHCDLIVEDINEIDTVGIEIEDQYRQLELDSKSIKFKIKLEYNIRINIVINKKLAIDTNKNNN